jgi:hypothetical protein
MTALLAKDSREFDAALSIRDRIRKALNEYGSQTIYTTVSEIAARAGVDPIKTYHALYGMRDREIRLITEQNGDRPKIVGVQILRLEPVTKIHRRSARKAKTRANGKFDAQMLESLTHLNAYIKQRLAVEEAKEVLEKNGVDPSQVQFEPNPLGDEAIYLLSRLTDTKQELHTMQFDLEAARRDIEFMKRERNSVSRNDP